MPYQRFDLEYHRPLCIEVCDNNKATFFDAVKGIKSYSEY